MSLYSIHTGALSYDSKMRHTAYTLFTNKYYILIYNVIYRYTWELVLFAGGAHR